MKAFRDGIYNALVADVTLAAWTPAIAFSKGLPKGDQYAFPFVNVMVFQEERETQTVGPTGKNIHQMTVAVECGVKLLDPLAADDAILDLLDAVANVLENNKFGTLSESYESHVQSIQRARDKEGSHFVFVGTILARGGRRMLRQQH